MTPTSQQEHHYEASDGLTGMCTVRGFFSDHLTAYRAFEAAHGIGWRGVAAVYRLDIEEEGYRVLEDGSLALRQRAATPGGHDSHVDYEGLFHMAQRRANRETLRADRYWAFLSDAARKLLADVGACPK